MARRVVVPPSPLLSLLLILLVSAGRVAHGRSISSPVDEAPADLPVADGVSSPSAHGSQTLLISFLKRPRSSRIFAAEQCEQTYGLLPCTTTVVGNMFLVVAYGFLMYKAATYLSSGSELLLEIMGPGIVDGLFLAILGALPDAMLILGTSSSFEARGKWEDYWISLSFVCFLGCCCPNRTKVLAFVSAVEWMDCYWCQHNHLGQPKVSGLSGSRETAQNQVLIGMGLLAGSTVMLLTVLWGSCVIVGKCDLSEDSTSIDSQDTKGFSLFGSGVSTDLQTSNAARIMAISIIPFVIVQMLRVFSFPSGQHLAVLLSFIVATVLLVSYCLYQVSIVSFIRLFHRLDLDSNGSLSHAELRALIIGIKIEEVDLDREDAVNKIMNEFDTSQNSNIEEEEFVLGISKWIDEAKRSVANSGAYSKKFMHEFHMNAKDQLNMLIDQSDEVVESIYNPIWICFKAILLLLLGTALAAIFADPLVDAVDNFSIATSIPSFFMSFIAMPLATNSSEAISSIIFACRRKQRTSSLTFSEVSVSRYISILKGF
ncbi:calcium-binding EF hand family protein [Musa troglodytarum]|uniref:Calcium-binding EF hand family protein n=1 Tax=Musa troglodytarum TaxID=320322 RepID=A0A9E7ET82_9LILI|nr:calcium-binding EF hand family protein [Musa troglodytarum]